MRKTGGAARRVLLCLVGAAVAVAALGAPAASAAIATTSITSPASPWVYAFDANASPTPTVTITGTSDGTSGNRYDIDCFYNELGFNYAVRIAANQSVGAGGAFSWTGTVNPMNFVTANLFAVSGITCQLRAVPAGAVTPGSAYNFPLAAYTGPEAELELRRAYQATGGPDDYWYTDSSLGATDGYNSVGDCGVYMYPRNPASGQYAYGFNLASTTNPYGGWDCAGTLSGSQDGGFGRSEIQIDGRNAFGSYGANAAFSTGGQASGFPPLTNTISRDPATGGNAVITESERLVSCADASYPATAAKCGGGKGTWSSDGSVALALDRPEPRRSGSDPDRHLHQHRRAGPRARSRVRQLHGHGDLLLARLAPAWFVGLRHLLCRGHGCPLRQFDQRDLRPGRRPGRQRPRITGGAGLQHSARLGPVPGGQRDSPPLPAHGSRPAAR